jgi:glutathione synthase/RimK-type ligase-like ATP-grasp enzyme
MKKIAFITSMEDPSLTSDDLLLKEPLKAAGYEISPLIWDQEQKAEFDGYIFRSCWNYHRKFHEFNMWLNNLENIKKPFINPISVSRWNLDKKYLLELQKKGARVPETQVVLKGESLGEIEVKASKLVIKPAVSLNGHETYLVDARETEKIKAFTQSIAVERDVLIQAFIPEIKTHGEISLIFIGGEFTHAIRKKTSTDEFRIHAEYGGTRESFLPSRALIDTAEEIIKLAPGLLNFVRVDLVETDQGAKLIELEVIDPMLYFAYSQNSVDAFVQMVKSSI